MPYRQSGIADVAAEAALLGANQLYAMSDELMHTLHKKIGNDDPSIRYPAIDFMVASTTVVNERPSYLLNGMLEWINRGRLRLGKLRESYDATFQNDATLNERIVELEERAAQVQGELEYKMALAQFTTFDDKERAKLGLILSARDGQRIIGIETIEMISLFS